MSDSDHMETDDGTKSALDDGTATDVLFMEQTKDVSSLPPEEVGITLIAKFSKDRIVLDDLASDTTILEVKLMLQEKTRILPKRQKLVGLLALEGGAKGVVDNLPISQLKAKGKSTGDDQVTHLFILMGTAEEDLFIDPQDRDDLPDGMFGKAIQKAMTLIRPRTPILTHYCFLLSHGRP
jgi:uncharacterized membrane protein